MVDELDKRLIAELARDARQASTELSRKLGVSDTTIRHRIYSLQKRRIITTTIVPDAFKLGYSVIALIALQVDLGSIDSIAEALSDHPSVHYIAECTGSHDMLIGVWLHSTQELTQFVKGLLSKLPGIRKSETFLILNVHKDGVGWLQSLGKSQ